MNRRTFLRHTSHAAAIPAFLGSFGLSAQRRLASLLKFTQETDRVLVLIFLQGGNDGLNTVVPLDQLSALNQVRPHVILPQNKLLPLNGTEVGLHPELDGLRHLFHEERLRIIQSVGYPQQNFSHFRSTDIWMSGSDADELVNSGWAGRYLNQTHPGFPDSYPNEDFADPLSIEIGYGSSLVFQGPTAPMNMVINNPDHFHELVGEIESSYPDTLAGEKLRHIQRTARQSQQYGEVVKTAAGKGNNLVDYPQGNELADQLRIVARLISGGLRTPLYLVNLNGFDTHDAQVEQNDHTKGEHATLLGKLDSAIMAFLRDLEKQGADDRVLGMTFSEFGRRIVSNASLGTDHGSAAPLFVFGNQVEPGILGQNPQIDRHASYEDNLPWEHDFRQIYSAILEQWFGQSDGDRRQVMLDEFDTVRILRQDVTRIEASHNRVGDTFRVFPNPVREQSTIQWYADGNPVRVEVLDPQGRTMQLIFAGRPTAGRQQLRWNPQGLAPGNYFLLLRGEQQHRSLQIVKLR